MNLPPTVPYTATGAHAPNPYAQLFPATTLMRPEGRMEAMTLDIFADTGSLIAETEPVLRMALPAGAQISRERITLTLQSLYEKGQAPLRAALKSARALHERNKASYEKLETYSKALETQLQQSRSEIKAAAEGRGVYENNKLAELRADLAHKETALTEASTKLTALNTELGKLKNESLGAAVKFTATEREKTELLGAAVLTAAAMRTAREALSEAEANIEIRYGTELPPFIAVLAADIKKALAALPA